MGKLGKADLKDLKALQEQLDKLSKVDYDRFFTEAAKEIAARLLAKVKKRTPVVYGSLRNAWGILPIEKVGNQYTITVINNLKYASYVEYGHRQTPGRFIPGHWEGERFIYTPGEKGGMVLKNTWIEGRQMLTISTQELERMAPALLDRKLKEFLKGVF